MGDIRVHIEVGARRTFATALDWPGWCRSGKDEATALATLLAYAPRYAVVARDTGQELPEPLNLTVVETQPGTATTDFGVPGNLAGGDGEPMSPAESARILRLVEASWRYFDSIAATAPEHLRKGPRGGGRDRDAIIDHVIASEAGAYAPKLGLQMQHAVRGDTARIAAARMAVIDRLRAGAPPPMGNRTYWPPRHAARRIAWHVLDHAWEMEDRSVTSAGGAGIDGS
jgi:hypothetical protein